MDQKFTRRAVIRGTVAAGALLPLAGMLTGPRAFAQSPALDPNDPTAKALGYVTASAKPDQKCAICALYQGKAGDAQGGCSVFAGKNVSANGWCKSWAKKS